jgi:hypothetical protein
MFNLIQNTAFFAMQLFHILATDAASDFPVIFNLYMQLNIAYYLFTVLSRPLFTSKTALGRIEWILTSLKHAFHVTNI